MFDRPHLMRKALVRLATRLGMLAGLSAVAHQATYCLARRCTAEYPALTKTNPGRGAHEGALHTGPAGVGQTPRARPEQLEYG